MAYFITREQIFKIDLLSGGKFEGSIENQIIKFGIYLFF